MNFMIKLMFSKAFRPFVLILVCAVSAYTNRVNGQIYATGFESGTISGTNYSQSFTGSTATGTMGSSSLGIAAATWNCTSSFTTYGGYAPTATTALATSTATPSTTTWTLKIPVNSGYAADISALQFDYRLSATSYNAVAISINGTSVYSGSLSATATFFTVLVSGLSVNCISDTIKVVYVFSGGSHGSGGTTRLDNVSLSGSVNALPSITTEPTSITIGAGTATSFSISATGASSYQWKRNTSGTIGGTWVNFDGSIDGGVYSNYTTGTLDITGATTTMNGYGYECIATNAYGCSVTSSAATLTVTAGIPCSGTPTSGSITPSSTNVCDSGTVSLAFTGGSSGTGLTYQWSSNTTGTPPGTNIFGATNTSYTASSVSTTTYYWCSTTCTVSSLSALSAVGVVSVAPVPTITVTPDGGNYCSGTSGLSMTASGASTYVWAPSTGLSATTGSDVTASATSKIIYTVIGTASSGCVGSDTVTVNYRISPSSPVLTPDSVVTCVGGGATLLTASSGVAGPSVTSSGTLSLTLSGTGYVSETPSITVNGIPTGAAITGVYITLNASFTSGYQNAYVFNLAAPNGKIINLIKGDGCGVCSGSYTSTVISSAGSSSVTTGSTPFTSTYAPDLFPVASGAYTQNTTLFSDLWGDPRWGE